MYISYPPMPEKICFTDDMLSPCCKNVKMKLRTSNATTDKVILNLSEQQNYVLYYLKIQSFLEKLAYRLLEILKI